MTFRKPVAVYCDRGNNALLLDYKLEAFKPVRVQSEAT
jgi:hypothetical protein